MYKTFSSLTSSLRGPGPLLTATFLFFLLLGPSMTWAIDCLTKQLPQPEEAYAVTKARLEAAGQWKPNNISSGTLYGYPNSTPSRSTGSDSW